MSRPLKTHCPYGHPYSGENLRINKKGQKECRTCNGWTGLVANAGALRDAPKRKPVIVTSHHA